MELGKAVVYQESDKGKADKYPQISHSSIHIMRLMSCG